MREVREAAHAEGDRHIEGRALIALSQVALYVDADNTCARELAVAALDLVEEADDVGRFDALDVLGTLAWWEGDLDEVERLAVERIAIAERIERLDLQSSVLLELNDMYNARLELGKALEPLQRAVELAEASGSPTTRGWVLRGVGRQAAFEGRLAEAEVALEQARIIFAESGAALTLGRTLNWLGTVEWERRDLRKAEETLREAIRVLKPLGDRGTLVESQRILAQVLLDQDRLDDAERFALEARETVGDFDVASDSTTRLALGLVRAAQRRDDEAERLLREADEILRPTGFAGIDRSVEGSGRLPARA